MVNVLGNIVTYVSTFVCNVSQIKQTFQDIAFVKYFSSKFSTIIIEKLEKYTIL